MCVEARHLGGHQRSSVGCEWDVSGHATLAATTGPVWDVSGMCVGREEARHPPWRSPKVHEADAGRSEEKELDRRREYAPGPRSGVLVFDDGARAGLPIVKLGERRSVTKSRAVAVSSACDVWRERSSERSGARERGQP